MYFTDTKTAKIKPSVAINNAKIFVFHFQPDFSWLLSVTFSPESWCASALLWPSLSREASPVIKPLIDPTQSCCRPRAPSALVPVLGCPPVHGWPRTMTQLCFPSSFCCCLAYWTPGIPGSTSIVCQPTYSLNNQCAADVRNPRAGVRGLVCSTQRCNAWV